MLTVKPVCETSRADINSFVKKMFPESGAKIATRNTHKQNGKVRYRFTTLEADKIADCLSQKQTVFAGGDFQGMCQWICIYADDPNRINELEIDLWMALDDLAIEHAYHYFETANGPKCQLWICVERMPVSLASRFVDSLFVMARERTGLNPVFGKAFPIQGSAYVRLPDPESSAIYKLANLQTLTIEKIESLGITLTPRERTCIETEESWLGAFAKYMWKFV